MSLNDTCPVPPNKAQIDQTGGKDKTESFLKLKDVQDRLGVSRSTVWRWHAEHGLRVITIGAVTRIRESDLADFLNRHVKGLSGANLAGSN